jgi:hypothetical protein
MCWFDFRICHSSPIFIAGRRLIPSKMPESDPPSGKLPSSRIRRTCKNCGIRSTGRYCRECGQRLAQEPITWKNIITEFPHALYHLNSGFLYTLKETVVSPGLVARTYLDGRRKAYTHPVTLLVVVATAVGIAEAYILHSEQYRILSEIIQWSGIDFGESYPSWVKWSIIIRIPFAACASRLAWKVLPYNLPQYFVIESYFTVQLLVLGSVLGLISLGITGLVITVAYQMGTAIGLLALQVAAYRQLSKGRFGVGGVIKGMIRTNLLGLWMAFLILMPAYMLYVSLTEQ